MTKTCFLLFGLLGAYFLAAQNRLVLNNDAFLVIDGGAFLVLENGNPNTITTLGSGGNIISENENDVIQWEIGTNTGSYNIPWTTNSGTKIPLTINKTTTGLGANAHFILSTWECATDMNIPWPSGIASMNFNGVDRSLFVADRYWHINALSYSTKPDIVMTVNYDPAANEIGGSNTIIESNLVAQRFNTNLNHWESTNLFGTNDAGNDRVVSINVPGTDFFEDWILVDISAPLPVVLSTFQVNCQEEEIHINWQTTSEINNDYFVLEKSYDGSTFFELSRIPGYGNANFPINYAFVDEDKHHGPLYYRLKQVDYDGAWEYFETQFANCKDHEFSISNTQLSGGKLTFNINSATANNLVIFLYDYTGKLIHYSQKRVVGNQTTIQINNLKLSTSTYLLNIVHDYGKDSFKLTNIKR